MTKWTVLGVWLDDVAIPVGAVAGKHTVYGEDDYENFEQGFWATTVEAEDGEAACTTAAEQMQAEFSGNEDET